MSKGIGKGKRNIKPIRGNGEIMKKLLIISIALGLCFTLSTVSFLFLHSRTVSAATEMTAPKAGAVKLININTSSAKELTGLKGIGEKTAQAIVAYRDKNGPFKAIEDIKKVKGIGDKKFDVIKSSICVK